MKIPLLVLCALLLGVADLAAETTEAILARMNDVAATFKGMSSQVSMTTYTKVIDDTEVESGPLQVQRQPGKPTRALLNLKGQSDSHVVFLFDNKVQIYTPKSKLLKTYSVSKSSSLVDQFLSLGFGSSGRELMQNYEINNTGSEKISGQETTHLVLVPKASEVKAKLAKVEIWIPVGKAYPVQQKFIEPNGNYRTSTYSDIAINPPMRGTLEFKAPPGTKKEQ
jgi:outer membrane lipoprotein-sorting protein